MDNQQPTFLARRVLIGVVLPLVVYSLISLIITWPLVKQLNTHAAGAGYSDTYEGVRGTWWFREAVLNGHNPFHQTQLVYPDGFTSWVQFTHPMLYIPPAALSLIVSPLTAFNLMLILTLIFNGTAAYWLGMTITGRTVPAALLGGTVFLAFPAMQGHLAAGHLGMLELSPLPLLILCLWRIIDEGAGWRTVAAGALCFALTGLSYVSHPVYILFPLVLFGGLYLLLVRRDVPWLKLGAVVAVGGLILLPFFVPLALGDGKEEVSEVAEPGRILYSTDPLSFVTPSPFGLLEDVTPDYAKTILGTNSIEGTAYLGVIPLALAILALRRRDMRMWGVIMLGAMIFSLGPYLKWDDRPLTVRFDETPSHLVMPWAAFQNLPFIDSSRAPGRFNFLSGVMISALVSAGAAMVVRRIHRETVRYALLAVCGVLILVEYQLFWPFQTIDARMPRYFRDLAQADDVRAVLNIPVENNLTAKVSLYQQVFHEKPLIAGHALRRTPQDPALLAVLDQAATADDPQIRRQDIPYLLSAAGADRVIVHKQDVPDSGAVVDRLRSILGEPEFEDDRWAAFVVPRVDAPPPDFMVAGALDSSWSERVDLGSFAGSFLADEGDWYLVVDRERQGELVFPAVPYRIPRKIGVWLDDHLINGMWIGEGDVHLPLILTPGFHTLHFEALDGCTDYPFALTCWQSPDLSDDCQPQNPPACISVGLGTPTWIEADPPLNAVDVRLADDLRLTAYQIDPQDGAVQVRLFWRGEDRLPESYALFIHIADPQTGQPLAQYADYPAFLTTKWGDDSRWVSDVRIEWPADLPPGAYDVNVGWFLPESNQRLDVLSDHPGADVDMIFLGTVDIH